MRKSLLPVLVAAFYFFSCQPSFRSSSVQYSNYRIQPSGSGGSSVTLLIKTYGDSVNKSMNDVIGHNEIQLEKRTRQNTLGYFMTDACLFMAERKYRAKVDAAFMNYGGIRLNELPAGNITRGKMYELMPFDNLLLLQKIKGNMLKQYLDTLALDEGISIAGISLRVNNKIAGDILVNGKALDENAEYVIANSDYNINNSAVLKNLPVQSINYLQRDALIDYVSFLKNEGKKITVTKTDRVRYD
jgi:2',3'-cyclic-nucleotide 2'-phosphodiesterase (5'-nucleotidase family)